MSEETNTNKEYATEAQEAAAMQQEKVESMLNEAETASVDETDELKNQITELTGALQRERAEFANFRKRAIGEKEQQGALTSARLLTDLLPALDAFEQFFTAYEKKALESADIKAIVEGVQLVQKQILRVFNEAGVEEVNPTGEEFNPNFMEALTLVEGDVEHETVMQVFQKGYRIQGRVIRPARVVVAKPKTPAQKTTTENTEQQTGEESN